MFFEDQLEGKTFCEAPKAKAHPLGEEALRQILLLLMQV